MKLSSLIHMHFLILILLGIFAFLPVSARENPIPPEYQTILKGKWNPTKEQTEAALAASIALVHKIATQPAGKTPDEKYEVGGAKAISQNLTEYAVQFIGLMDDRKKIICCSFFPREWTKSVFKDWKTNGVMAMGGGSFFWLVAYYPETGKCGPLRIHAPE